MGVDKSSLLAANRDVSQAWGRAVAHHPAGFQGIKYVSRFLDQPCLARFGRNELKGRLKSGMVGTLNDLEEAIDWLHNRRAALV